MNIDLHLNEWKFSDWIYTKTEYLISFVHQKYHWECQSISPRGSGVIYYANFTITNYTYAVSKPGHFQLCAHNNKERWPPLMPKSLKCINIASAPIKCAQILFNIKNVGFVKMNKSTFPFMSYTKIHKYHLAKIKVEGTCNKRLWSAVRSYHFRGIWESIQ